MNTNRSATRRGIDWPDAPIFVVDDDLHWLEVMHRALESLGWREVRTLSEPRYACQLAGEFRPAAVLLDLMMSEKDGHQVLRELRHDQPELPIIIVTGRDAIEDAVACMREGATHFMTKPLARDELRETLRRIVIDRDDGRKNGDGLDFREVLAQVDDLPSIKEMPDMLVEEALRRSGGIVKDAAEMIGVSAQAICNRKRRAADRD